MTEIAMCMHYSSIVGANVAGRLGDASDWLNFCAVNYIFCVIIKCLLENIRIFNWRG